jgi:hypothetical protein
LPAAAAGVLRGSQLRIWAPSALAWLRALLASVAITRRLLSKPASDRTTMSKVVMMAIAWRASGSP